MNAASQKGVQINRQRCDQCLAFTRPHFSNPASMENDSPDQLNIKVPHPERPAAGFPADGESFG
jgi:hypothetical protein